MVLIGGLFLAFLAGARIFGTGSDFQSHVFPAAAFSLLVVALTGPQAAIVLTGALAALTGLTVGNSLEFAVLVAVGGCAAILSLNRLEPLPMYCRAGISLGAVNRPWGLRFQ